jgi:RNA-binding motif X-linked protein 2
MNKIQQIKKLNDLELEKGLTMNGSWHDQYKKTAHIYIGGLLESLTEGDIISIFSQYGEILDINLVRDKQTGISKGFCFLLYENQKSTVLAVDNFNGVEILGRVLSVDHSFYENRDDEEDARRKMEMVVPSHILHEHASNGSGDANANAGSREQIEDPMFEYIQSQPKRKRDKKEKKEKRDKKDKRDKKHKSRDRS